MNQGTYAVDCLLPDSLYMTQLLDIPKGTPRDAGLGIVTLAKLSGRPIIPLAVATSRRKVLEKSWDKTTINLPFGRGAAIVGDPILVPADAGEAEMEEKRQEVTAGLNAATERAYPLGAWAQQLRRYGYRTAAFYPPAVFFIDEHRFRRLRDENLEVQVSHRDLGRE